MKLIAKISQYERIVAYMTNPEAELSELSEKDKEVLNRWMEAFTMQRNYKSSADAAAILMKRFPGLSRAQAYRDCSNSISLFGDISTSTKDGIKHLSSEIIKDAINIARLKNNEDAMIKGANALAKVNGVNVTDPDLPDFSKLEPHTYVLGLPDTLVKVLTEMAKGGKMDLTQVVNNMSNFAIDAEEVEEDGD